jgi:hypothetical protein
MDSSFDEHRYPVIVSTTNHYLVWQEGENQKDAVDRMNDDPDWYEALDRPVDADYEVRAPEPWEYQGTVYSPRIGPLNRCRKCDGQQYYIETGVAHAAHCPELPPTGDTNGH